MRFTYTYSKDHQKAKKPSRVMPLGSSSSLLANRDGGRGFENRKDQDNLNPI